MGPSNGRGYLSRHVIFDEQTFPFSEAKSVPPSSQVLDPLIIFGSIKQWLPTVSPNLAQAMGTVRAKPS